MRNLRALAARARDSATGVWVWFAACLVAATLLFLWRGELSGPGDWRNIIITVVPDDERALGCASERTFGEGLACAYTNANPPELRSGLQEQSRLAPYVTIGRELMVLSGVFSFPEVTAEAKRRRGMEKQRFVVTCRVQLVERVSRLPIRFSARHAFKSSGPVWIAGSAECQPER